MAVAVQDEVRSLIRDRLLKAFTAEEDADRLRLAFDRGQSRRVVEEDDPDVAAGDLAQPAVDGGHLGARLGVDTAEQRLAEVGEQRPSEAADEPLRPDDPDLAPADLADLGCPLEHVDSAA